MRDAVMNQNSNDLKVWPHGRRVHVYMYIVKEWQSGENDWRKYLIF